MTHPKGQGQGSCHRQSSKHTVSSLRRLFERRSKQNSFYLLGFYLLALCLTLIYFSNLRKLSTTTKYRGWRQENVATWKVFLVQIWANFTGIPSQKATHKQNNSRGGGWTASQLMTTCDKDDFVWLINSMTLFYSHIIVELRNVSRRF